MTLKEIDSIRKTIIHRIIKSKEDHLATRLRFTKQFSKKGDKPFMFWKAHKM
jgi:hypothetical protein